MSVSIQEFATKKGKMVKYIEISGENYPIRMGIKKVKAVLENQKDCEFLLRQLGVLS